MEKNKFNINSVITIKRCLEFLNFIPEDIMKRNVAYNLQYLDFLNEVYKSYTIDRSVEKSFIKNQIMILGSLLECFTFSLLSSFSSNIDFGKGWKEKGLLKKYITLNDQKRVKTVIEELSERELKKRSDFSWMIDIAKKNKIFGKEYASVAHFVREHRNKVHLTSMEELEYEYFTPEKLKEAQGCVKKFLEQLSGKTKEEIKNTFLFL